jgi:hypothetical protein
MHLQPGVLAANTPEHEAKHNNKKEGEEYEKEQSQTVSQK